MKDGLIYQNLQKDTKSIIHTNQVHIHLLFLLGRVIYIFIVLEFTARMEAEFILLVRQWRHESIGNTVSTTDSEVDLSATPSTTNNAQGRKWGNRQLINQPSISSSNLNSSPIATTVKRNYPEESDFYYQLDDPNSVSLLPRLPPSHVQLVLVRLLDVIQRQIKSGELETPDDWQAQVHT
jgi:hypothetical protein